MLTFGNPIPMLTLGNPIPMLTPAVAEVARHDSSPSTTNP